MFECTRSVESCCLQTKLEYKAELMKAVRFFIRLSAMKAEMKGGGDWCASFGPCLCFVN
jgi:hypothetical protein